MEFFSVENSRGLVKEIALWRSFGKIHRGLWRKKAHGSKEKVSFPHKFSLLLLYLPIIIYGYIYYISFRERKLDYALYL